MKPELLTKIRIIILIVIFSLGKIIAATGQTLFGMRHATGYLLKNGNVSVALAGFAALCSLAVILMTRVPAISRQFRTSVNVQIDTSLAASACRFRRAIFNGFIFCSLASGIFSAIGAYLSAITISEFMKIFFTDHANYLYSSYIQLFAIFVALSTFVSYYSFNYYKSRQNAIKFVSITHLPHAILLPDKNVMKTIFVSILSLLSIPFLSYFLTKHALLSMPHVESFLSLSGIKYIAAGSAVTALITSLITNIPAAYEYFVANEKSDHDESIHTIPDSVVWKTLRNFTYSTGFFDCTANGLSNFVSVIDVAHDAFELDTYGNIIYLAIGCGISSALLTAAFSVRQGFNDFASEHQDESTPDKIMDIGNAA